MSKTSSKDTWLKMTEVFRLRLDVVDDGLGDGAELAALRTEWRAVGVEIEVRPERGSGSGGSFSALVAGETDAVLAPLGSGRGNLPAGCEWFVPKRGLKMRPADPGAEKEEEVALFFRGDDRRLLLLRALHVAAVTFVGGGPGDPGLCTVAGIEALRRCEVCLYDALVPAALLAEMPAAARAVYVGKRCGSHSLKQKEISETLADYARRGFRVVRLKGGDPGIFGRLAEEIETFDRYHLPYRVVPGVSSLLAATTGTGMFLTRRGISRGFTVLTPRRAGDNAGACPVYGPDREMPPRPVVFFMAMGRIGELVENLRKRGRQACEPAAVVWGASTPGEIVVRGTLGDIAERVKEYDGDLPGIFMLGETTRFSLADNWSALKEEAVLLLVRPEKLKACTEEVRAFGGRPVIPPPLLELSGVERRRPVFTSVILTDARVADEFRRQWGELPEKMVYSGTEELELVRELARARVAAKLREPESGEAVIRPGERS